MPSTTSSEPPIIGSLSINLQWWVLLLGLFDLGWVLRFGNEVGCGLVMAVVLWLWRQFGGCGGYFLGCCGFFFFFNKLVLVDGFVSVVTVGVVAAVVVGGCCCDSGGCTVVYVVVVVVNNGEELIYYFNVL